jgi:hypothetical protein
MEKSKIRQLAAETIAFNDGLREAQKDYERMSRLKYELPEPLRDFEWVNPIISTAPYDAIRGATRALANLNEVPKIHPATVLKSLGTDVRDTSREAAEKANEWEQVLIWNMDRASRRRAAFRSNAIWSAALYNEVNAQVIHLPTQFKARSMTDSSRSRAALRFGDWAIRMVDAKNVAVAYSDFMPERVVGMRKMKARGLVDFWQESAASIARKISEDPAHGDVEYAEFDFVDYDQRYVWAVEGGDISSADDEGETILEPAPWLVDLEGKPVPFLPWINVAGGTELDDKPEYQRKPILFPVRQAEQWAVSNIFGTILMSMAQAEAAAPVDVFIGPGSEQVKTDYTKPGGRLSLTALQRYERVKRAGLDDSIKEAYDRIDTAIRRSTVADILVTGSPAPNIEAAYAYNLQIQTALASLGDVKEIGERFYDRAYETMLLISHYTGTDIEGYRTTGKDTDKRYVISSEDIDPQAIYLSVELKPDVPADRMQRIQGASTLVQTLQYSPAAAMEFLGEADPEGKLLQWKLWQIDLADLQGKLDRMRAESSGKYQQDVMVAAQGLVAQMQQTAPQGGMGGGLPGGGEGAPMEPGGSPTTGRALPGEEARAGVEGVGGPMYNTAEGGMPTAAVAPEATREQQTGEAAGVPLAGA